MQASHHCAKCQLKDSRSHWYRSIAIRQQDSLRTVGCTHTGSTNSSDNYLPSWLTISARHCSDDAAFKPSIFTISYICINSPCLQVLVTLSIYDNIRSFPYFMLRVHVCKCWYHCHSLEISISFSLSSLKGPWLPHSCKSIVIRQQVSLRKYGWTHTGQSPLCKMSGQGQPAALIQAHRH